MFRKQNDANPPFSLRGQHLLRAAPIQWDSEVFPAAIFFLLSERPLRLIGLELAAHQMIFVNQKFPQSDGLPGNFGQVS